MVRRILDLFSGAGGAAMGYHRAGFEVVGIDIQQRKRYPFEFHQADALEYLDAHWSEFDAVHASPPCQAYSQSTNGFRNAGKVYPDLLVPTREALAALPIPWVIENVPGAPMRADYRLCGCFFGLALRRDRWFETSWHGFSMMPTHDHSGDYVTVIGGGTPTPEILRRGRNTMRAERQAAMGINWMSNEEMSLAIPPAYTEWLGLELLAVIEAQVA
jgi:DNA (cytosine-5)-methyltransferase 1